MEMENIMPTILVVEDVDSNYLLLSTILRNRCRLIRAKTGREALDLFDQEKLDLILMDIKLPEITGLDVLRKIRQKGSEIPVIIQSAYVFDYDREAAKEAGASYFLAKPIIIPEFKRILSEFCPAIVW